ncbi:hypothetical protein RB195_013689 [Necator americanus]|uniref:Adenylate kinase isoenzyme 1 n=1 Tax=Necator americanus TaxID=51031 RepID=A0ABR1DWS4_NECAM
MDEKKLNHFPLKKANVPALFVLGRPGTDKSTYSTKLATTFELSYISCGDLIRNEIKLGTSRSAQLLKPMNEGQLCPKEAVLELLKEAILKELNRGAAGFVIDGFPREMKQGELFEHEIQEFKSLVFLDVPVSTVTENLKKRANTRGRIDDNVKTIENRLMTFDRSTIPVIEHYEKEKKLLRITTTGPVEKIIRDVLKQLDKLSEKRLEASTVKRKSIDLTPLKKAAVPIFFIAGGPGSGKGTQCEKIVAKYGLSHLSSGDLLRDEVKSGSPRGALLSKIMEAGELVPLEVVLDLIKEAMLKEVAKGCKGFLVDGYPREVKQGEQFEQEIQEAKSVIFFDVTDEILIERLLKRAKTSGRVDDNFETIKKRLNTFRTATKPVVDYYEKKKKLVRIVAEGTIEEIFAKVAKHLDECMGQKELVDLTPLKKANVPIFFIVGGPGSGKGTQCEKIVARYSLSHLSSGDLLREEVKSSSPRGAQLNKIMEAGGLVPLEVVLNLVKEAMLKAVAKGTNGFLIDGYPREVSQGEQFEKEIYEAKSVIFFEVSDNILIERLLKRAKTSGRVDDNLETVKKRLNTFKLATAPVVEYYEKKKKLIRIQANGSIEEVFDMVVKHLDTVIATK